MSESARESERERARESERERARESERERVETGGGRERRALSIEDRVTRHTRC